MQFLKERQLSTREKMAEKMEIALIGYGAIASYVIEQIMPLDGITVVAVICREQSLEKARNFARGRFQVFTSVTKLNPKPDILVDCAGHAGLLSHASSALKNGIDVISISTGALAQQGILEKLEESAGIGKSKIKFLSGAVGGIDALTSAGIGEIESVVYTARKPPVGWMGSPAENLCDLMYLKEPFVHFSGTAREAARLYPKNANVAATIALASIGLDNVTAKLIADPSVERNVHEIEACGSFGKLNIKLEGNPLPNNPKSSALAAMSIVAELKRRFAPIEI